MESSKELLEKLLTDEVLDSLIQDTACLQTLKPLLEVKHERIIGGQCEKITLSLNSLYDSDVDVDLAAEILKRALYVTRDNTLLSQTQSFCLSKLQSSRSLDELYYCCNLLNVLFEYYKSEKLALMEWKSDEFSNGILNTLVASSKPLFTFVTIYLLPNYFTVCSRNNKNLFLENAFKFIRDNKRLDFLCVLWAHFIPVDLTSNNFNVLKVDEFWKLVIESLSTQSQKQAIYLLSKSTEIAFKPENIPHIPNYLKVENESEIEKIWRNYFTLLDVSNEKQLHFIEPSLHMLGSIKHLQIEWRLCLYKILLNHSQTSVVYSVANFIIENENVWQDFSKILENLLHAVNKHECNEQSKSVFRKIGIYCSKLNEFQFQQFLVDCMNPAWTPSALWGLFSNIFTDEMNFQISFELFSKIIKKIKVLPHKFIRESCTRIVFQHFIRNHTLESVDDVFKISILLYDFNEALFRDFITKNAQNILNFKDELCDKFQACDEWVEIKVRIFQILKIKIPVFPVTPTQQNDLIFGFLLEDVETSVLEKYVISRIESVLETDDISALLNILLKFTTPKLCENAEIILSRQQYNPSQKIIALGILKQNRNSITFCKNLGKKSDPLTTSIVKILLNSLHDNSSEITDCINFFEAVFDKQSNATITILENISVILKFIDRDFVFDFFILCLNEFLNLHKSGNFRTTASVFLKQIFEAQFFENGRFCNAIFDFVKKLLPLANTANSVTYCLAKMIRSVCQQNPQMGLIFVPVIAELILHGIVISKNERVEYNVCQEIYSKLGKIENNPNFEEMSVRLTALDTMLDLINNPSLETEVVVSQFVSVLIEKYNEYFSKRYFPDSLIHFQKLRIMQTLLLLHEHIKAEKTPLVNLLIKSFLLESHQPSVKHLMQWLLISLLQTDSDVFIQTINNNLKSVNNNRPSTTSGFIPILYNLVTLQREAQWEQVTEMLLPYTMGPQFKLRIFSQVALVKLYEKAKDKRLDSFTEKYKILYNSLKQVLAATNSVYDSDTIQHEFLDFINLSQCDCSTIFYLIPRKNAVSATEWENLKTVSDWEHFKFISFNHSDNNIQETYAPITTHTIASDNIQKKITPWKDFLSTSPSQENNFILVTTLIEKSTNLGGLSRTCEVFGIKQIVMRTAKIISDKEFKSLSMSSENSVEILEVKPEDLASFILNMKAQGYSVVGAEQTSESVKLDAFRFDKKTVLVLGNEKEGIPPDLIPLLDHCIEIPQFGLVRSLNVHVAGAIVIWEYCKQHRL
ncbi:uncharacterized protein LOC103315209 [Tribolium castaneum]|uniref:tRNA (guanosine(18)-2'-O)-methyltransferase TARBP1 n=1 Tax=Tribolium castaneum TaxID=7070 RepID=D6WA65_TRICA|nr:PREDICTED: uncharacterized protein LOC103315209 [Tribolium castaneum]EEZ98052.1 hypothetical protein TcasGA2_TC000457 [Tribolium castaneum]|eukprot:XP_008201525.1 PREDICTED: uncharacterized protein LOC103315209 [Tribolium castaneum]